jgi:Molybdopterin oxidoreductase
MFQPGGLRNCDGFGRHRGGPWRGALRADAARPSAHRASASKLVVDKLVAELFIVVQDAFMTETTEFADVALPAALWGEKTGCFTNADRTVHGASRAAARRHARLIRAPLPRITQPALPRRARPLKRTGLLAKPMNGINAPILATESVTRVRGTEVFQRI